MVSDLRSAHPHVIFTAAHGGFDNTRVPLGGAAAVYAMLVEAWGTQQPFPLKTLTSDILGPHAPQDKDLVHYSEMRYAQFCFEFGKAATAEILKHDPKDVIVLINDVSEGPDFRFLFERGYTLFTIYHVNVVDYFAEIYLRGWCLTESLTAWYARTEKWGLTKLFPKVLSLIFAKQRDSLMYSRAVIVPSEGMKRILLKSYPETPAGKISVLPWGTPKIVLEETAILKRKDEIKRQYGIPEKARVVLTLSRISPEKGQDRLLEALIQWEKAGDLPEEGLWVLICGEAAYMQGLRFQKRLHQLAQKLKKVHVLFPGFLSGLEKQAHFRLADLYVFPSRHESYGLTLLEAYQAGLPALVCSHYGAEGLVQPDFGELVPSAADKDVPHLLQKALKRLLSNPETLKDMGRRAKEFSQGQSFSETARRLGEIIQL